MTDSDSAVEKGLDQQQRAPQRCTSKASAVNRCLCAAAGLDCGVFTGLGGNHLASHWPEADAKVPTTCSSLEDICNSMSCVRNPLHHWPATNTGATPPQVPRRGTERSCEALQLEVGLSGEGSEHSCRAVADGSMICLCLNVLPRIDSARLDQGIEGSALTRSWVTSRVDCV